MTGRLADIEARIETVHQLSAVISAMRGLASARTLEANRHLAGVRTYAGTIATAIGEALHLSASDAGPADTTSRMNTRHLVIALCAEQGFAGSFSRKILERVDAIRKVWIDYEVELMIVGDRGLLTAEEFGLTHVWSAPMISSSEQATLLANRIMDALYQRLDRGTDTRVTLIHAMPDASAQLDVVEKQLVPFDYSRFPAVTRQEVPLLNLPPAELVAQLADEYIFAELCEGVILSYAAENEARMRAMVAAQENVSDTMDQLTADARRQRQEEITNEIGELSSSILSR